MDKLTCQTCLSAKTTIRCGICAEVSCKSCSQFIDEDAFSFLPSIPAELSKGTYCHACFETKVRPELETYEAAMDAAAKIDVYLKDQGKETRWISRSKTVEYTIENCLDRNELLLRLAFRAVLDGFTTLVDVDITSVKIRDGSYQKSVFKGYAVPAKVEHKVTIKDRSLRHNPN